jgi:hypothetical protein
MPEQDNLEFARASSAHRAARAVHLGLKTVTVHPTHQIPRDICFLGAEAGNADRTAQQFNKFCLERGVIVHGWILRGGVDARQEECLDSLRLLRLFCSMTS